MLWKHLIAHSLSSIFLQIQDSFQKKNIRYTHIHYLTRGTPTVQSYSHLVPTQKHIHKSFAKEYTSIVLAIKSLLAQGYQCLH